MTFNSKEYSWNEMNIVLLGRLLIGVKELKYTITQEKQPIYGRGNKPLSIQRGKKNYSGTLTLLQSELEALVDASPKGDIMDLLDFDITVSYASRNGMIRTDVIKYAQFTEVPDKGMGTDDLNMEVALPFVALNIKTS